MEKVYAIPQIWCPEYPNFNKHIRWNMLVIKKIPSLVVSL